MWTWENIYINQCVVGARLLFLKSCARCRLTIFAVKIVGVTVLLRCVLVKVQPMQQGTIFAAKIVCSRAGCVYLAAFFAPRPREEHDAPGQMNRKPL
ncbi:MAG: hypothetical protein FD162_3017 [Rhodobacteraceae bacterium]|nr:MAG: hypothetical protein FD162_3017 [Paracoccaceae bacterium]